MATYELEKYLLVTLDPVHVGTGGYRLGRVDNSIVREPGTRIPKIPGTSLHGAARSYAAQLYETPEAAGQKHDDVKDPDQNPVCYTFGYIKKIKENEKTDGGEEETIAYSGVVNIFDARILLFPVYSMIGPVWVTTLGRLKDAGFIVKNGTENIEKEPPYGKAFLSFSRETPFNLGWLMVEIEKNSLSITPPADSGWEKTQRWQAVKDHIVLVNEALFSHIVNSNLEVRTSVSIDPKTGAAEEGALFTYEAIPRATFLVMDVVLDDYRNVFPKRKCGKGETDKGNALPGGAWNGPLDVVKAGLRMIEYLGVGGMGTRGFGRIALVERESG